MEIPVKIIRCLFNQGLKLGPFWSLVNIVLKSKGKEKLIFGHSSTLT